MRWADLENYFAKSVAGLGRGIDAANKFTNEKLPQHVAPFLPGAGLVQGNQDMRDAGEWWRQGSPGRAAASGAQGVMNSVLDVNPVTSALPALGLAKRPDPIRAYHGSPHDFDKFDMSKIGTGEGAQAYGHGLYFAENEGVARGYRDALRPGSGTAPEDIASRILQSTGDDPAQALAEIRRRIDDANRRGADYTDIQRLMNVKNIINTNPHKATGRMYEVNIHADPNKFLDWDAGGQQVYRDRISELDNKRANLKSKYGEESIFAKPTELVRRELVEEDIPGIKYLDQGSRAAGEGSRNYVLFRDDIVEILKKYGVASVAALPPAVQAAIQMGRAPEKEGM